MKRITLTKIGFILMLVMLILLVGCQNNEQINQTKEGVSFESKEINENIKNNENNLVNEKEVFQVDQVYVTAYGAEGFNPKEVNIKKGGKIIFTNKNSKKKDIVITLQKDGSRKFINTKKIMFGTESELVLEESGDYEFWTMGFVPRGKIVVS